MCVAEGVVHQLEAVDVEEHHRDPRCRESPGSSAIRAIHCSTKARFGSPVELVVGRLVREPRFRASAGTERTKHPPRSHQRCNHRSGTDD